MEFLLGCDATIVAGSGVLRTGDGPGRRFSTSGSKKFSIGGTATSRRREFCAHRQRRHLLTAVTKAVRQGSRSTMQIGIIGAGQIGGTLTRRLTALGHDVRVANSRDPLTLAELANETGATAVWASEAAVGADLVIVSIPQKNVPALADSVLHGAKEGAPVIETNNYYPKQRDGLIERIEAGTPESVWVAG